VSYILDALKKSEQERARGAIPDIKTVHQPRPVEYNKPSRWPYILLIVLLLNAGGLGFWIYQQNMLPVWDSSAGNVSSESSEISDSTEGIEAVVAMTDIPTIDNRQTTQGLLSNALQPTKNQPDQNRDATKSDNKKRVVPTPPENSEKPKTDSLPKERSSSGKPNVIFSDQPLTVSENELKNAESVDDLAVLSDVQVTPDANSTVSEFSEAMSETKDDTIYDIAELPESVKRELPSISFAGHVYSSTQSQRSVMLNGKKMREGQEVTKGLILEEITVEGVVLRSQGYRFKLGALQDWSF
jgi:general secretion pathway protein B